MRIVTDNAADRATLAATSAAGDLLPANLQINDLEAVWRTNAAMLATLTMTWSEDEAVDSLAIGWVNLSPDSAITLRRWNLALSAYDQIVVAADSLNDMSLYQPGSSGLYIGSASANNVPCTVEAWWPSWAWTRKIEVIISDPGTYNLSGYIEAGRLVAGMRAELPSPGPGFGLAMVDRTITARAESGALRAASSALRADPGAWYRRLSMDLNYFPEMQRAALMTIAKGRAMHVSVYPNDTRKGKLYAGIFAAVDDLAMRWPIATAWSSSLVLEEVA